MYDSASARFGEYATTEMPWPPSCEPLVLSLGLTKKPILSPPTFGSLYRPGKKANQFIIIATWPDLNASRPSPMYELVSPGGVQHLYSDL